MVERARPNPDGASERPAQQRLLINKAKRDDLARGNNTSGVFALAGSDRVAASIDKHQDAPEYALAAEIGRGGSGHVQAGWGASAAATHDSILQPPPRV